MMTRRDLADLARELETRQPTRDEVTSLLALANRSIDLEDFRAWIATGLRKTEPTFPASWAPFAGPNPR